MTIVDIILVVGVLATAALVVYALLILPEISVKGPIYPISLFLDSRFAVFNPEVLAALSEAVEFFNESLGWKLFLVPDVVGNGTVVPILYCDHNVPRKFCYENSFAFTKTSPSCAVYVIPEKISNCDEEELKYGFAHELGHVAGLQHDSFTNSIMYYKGIPECPEITSKHCEYLRETYK